MDLKGIPTVSFASADTMTKQRYLCIFNVIIIPVISVRSKAYSSDTMLITGILNSTSARSMSYAKSLHVFKSDSSYLQT